MPMLSGKPSRLIETISEPPARRTQSSKKKRQPPYPFATKADTNPLSDSWPWREG